MHPPQVDIATYTASARRILKMFAARLTILAVLFASLSAHARPLWGLGNLFSPPSRALAESNVPHPAVARIIVPERDGTAYGSGSLVDVRGEYGLVVTNHHVVEYAAGPIDVVFPNGFRSLARAQKLDSDWDLAALVIWRPEGIEPIKLADRAPRPGDVLTICGYGSGKYRSITGRCTDYYAPRIGWPRELVELDVEARQGDSGGPIFNSNNELAGVLFGAGQGTTLGSFGGRVGGFLTQIAPDIGKRDEAVVVKAMIEPPPPPVDTPPEAIDATGFAEWQSAESNAPEVERAAVHESNPINTSSARRSQSSFDNTKSFLAAICVLAVVMQFLRLFR